MTTRNAIIYHCITCGRIEHAELGAERPQCCGHAMSKASEDTIHSGEVAGDTPGGQVGKEPSTESKGEKAR